MIGKGPVIGVKNPYGLIQMAGKPKKRTPKSRRNTRKNTRRKSLKNTNKKSCKSRKMTSCCPHMPPNHKGEYAATTKNNTLYYLGNKYKLYTCCNMCSEQMNRIADENPKLFAKKYIYKKTPSKLYLKNQATRKMVQIAIKC